MSFKLNKFKHMTQTGNE